MHARGIAARALDVVTDRDVGEARSCVLSELVTCVTLPSGIDAGLRLLASHVGGELEVHDLDGCFNDWYSRARRRYDRPL